MYYRITMDLDDEQIIKEISNLNIKEYNHLYQRYFLFKATQEYTIHYRVYNVHYYDFIIKFIDNFNILKFFEIIKICFEIALIKFNKDKHFPIIKEKFKQLGFKNVDEELLI